MEQHSSTPAVMLAAIVGFGYVVLHQRAACARDRVIAMTKTIEDTATLCDSFAATAATHADEPALRTADGAVDWSWREYADRVRAAAAGLHGLGVRRGDTVALWLSNRPEFHVADAAALQIGAAAVLDLLDLHRRAGRARRRRRGQPRAGD